MILWNETQIPVTVIIAAAGSSVRMGENKLLLPLDEIPVLVHTLWAFEQCELVDDIIVVCRESDIGPYHQLARTFQCTKVQQIIRGGENRTQSVLAGLRACQGDSRLVAIHDGARPLVPQSVIEQTILAAAQSGAAAPVVPLKDSIKCVREGKILHDVPRDTIAAVQTPQVFRRAFLLDALLQAIASDTSFTDDCAAVEQLGISVTATQGSYRNIKITTPEDIMIAQAFLLSQEV